MEPIPGNTESPNITRLLMTFNLHFIQLNQEAAREIQEKSQEREYRPPVELITLSKEVSQLIDDVRLYNFHGNSDRLWKLYGILQGMYKRSKIQAESVDFLIPNDNLDQTYLNAIEVRKLRLSEWLDYIFKCTNVVIFNDAEMDIFKVSKLLVTILEMGKEHFFVDNTYVAPESIQFDHTAFCTTIASGLEVDAPEFWGRYGTNFRYPESVAIAS